jgi:hypothetical protein
MLYKGVLLRVTGIAAGNRQGWVATMTRHATFIPSHARHDNGFLRQQEAVTKSLPLGSLYTTME